MIGLQGKQVTLLDGELLRRERDNRGYMLRLTRENLMRNYLLEAGLYNDTDLDPAIISGANMTPYKTVAEAVKDALAANPEAKVLVFMEGSVTIPKPPE